MDKKIFSGQTKDTEDNKRKTISRQRSNIEIIADILRVSEDNSAGRGEITWGADVSDGQMQNYLDYLKDQGFISRADLDSTSEAYRVTESGLNFLKAIDNLMKMLGTNREEKP